MHEQDGRRRNASGRRWILALVVLAVALSGCDSEDFSVPGAIEVHDGVLYEIARDSTGRSSADGTVGPVDVRSGDADLRQSSDGGTTWNVVPPGRSIAFTWRQRNLCANTLAPQCVRITPRGVEGLTDAATWRPLIELNFRDGWATRHTVFDTAGETSFEDLAISDDGMFYVRLNTGQVLGGTLDGELSPTIGAIRFVDRQWLSQVALLTAYSSFVLTLALTTAGRRNRWRQSPRPARMWALASVPAVAATAALLLPDTSDPIGLAVNAALAILLIVLSAMFAVFGAARHYFSGPWPRRFASTRLAAVAASTGALAVIALAAWWDRGHGDWETWTRLALVLPIPISLAVGASNSFSPWRRRANVAQSA